jgi:hypothetical protein
MRRMPRSPFNELTPHFAPQGSPAGTRRIGDYASSGRDHAASLAFVFGAAAYAAAVGYLVLHDRLLAELAVAAAFGLGAVAGNVVRLAIVATAGVWITKRAPGVNISFTDLLVAATGAVAFFDGAAQAIPPRGRIVLKSFAIYLYTLGVTLIFNQSLRSDLEWLHRVALVAGAVMVGAWIVRAGTKAAALRALLAVTVFISIFAIADSVSSGFLPAQPFGYQKNFIGSITATVLLVLLAAHREFRLPASALRAAAVLVGAGLVASESRGAMVAVAVGTLIWWFRQSSMATPRLRRLAILGAVGLVVFTAASVKSEFASHNPITSLTQRFQVERATEKLWIDHPLTGVGLRFFKTPAYAGYQAPNNVLNEILAEAGVLGFVGFLVFVIGSLWGLGRLKGDLATAALCVVAGRFVHGLFDIYWTGGTTTLVWIVAGMGLASASSVGRDLPR